jgi:hypothetical protein
MLWQHFVIEVLLSLYDVTLLLIVHSLGFAWGYSSFSKRGGREAVMMG